MGPFYSQNTNSLGIKYILRVNIKYFGSGSASVECRAGFGYLLLQDVNLPLLHVQHVFQVSDLSRQRALLVRQVLQLFGLLGQELLLLLQPHTQSVNLGDTEEPSKGRTQVANVQ